MTLVSQISLWCATSGGLQATGVPWGEPASDPSSEAFRVRTSCALKLYAETLLLSSVMQKTARARASWMPGGGPQFGHSKARARARERADTRGCILARVCAEMAILRSLWGRR